MLINSKRDLRQYISGMFDRVDIKCYTLSLDELIDAVAEDILINLKCVCGFEWGDNINDYAFSENFFWSLVDAYKVKS